MYRIASTLTQFVNDKNGPVRDEEGKHVHKPITCLFGSFRWPPEGIIVPDDFFADDGMFISLVKHPGLEISKSDDGKEWRHLRMEDVDGAAGSSPSSRPAPSPDAMRQAMANGIIVTPQTTDRSQPRGPMNEVPASKVREHLEAITAAKAERRGRKGQQQIDG